MSRTSNPIGRSAALAILSYSAKIFESLQDLFNPIVVKEMKQAVQGKFVSSLLLLLLAVQLLVVGTWVLMTPDVARRFDTGAGMFMTLEGLLLGICILFIPSYTGIRLISERSPANMDLLFITTISPRAIIAGKSLAAAALTLLIFSACMPFMVLTYLMRGIDLPSMFMVLALSFFLVVIAIQMTVFVACVPASRPMQLVLGILELVILFLVFSMTMGTSYSLLFSGIGASLGSWSFWGPALSFGALGLMLTGLLFFLSVALISPASANRALPVRSFMTVAWLLSGAVCILWQRSAYTVGTFFPANPFPFHPDAMAFWDYATLGVLAIGLLVAASEREVLGPRVTLQIPRKAWLRGAAFPFFSGAANGLLWSLLMIALTLAVSSLPVGLGGSRERISSADIGVMGAFALYILAYVMTALFVRRRLLASTVTVSLTWVVALLLLAVGCAMPLSIRYSFVADAWNPSHDLWFLGNPFRVRPDANLIYHVTFAAIWAAVASILNGPWFIRQCKAFRPNPSPPGTGG